MRAAGPRPEGAAASWVLITLLARPGPGCSTFLPFSICWRGGLLTSGDGRGSGKGVSRGAGAWRLTRSPLYHLASFLRGASEHRHWKAQRLTLIMLAES